MFMFLNADSRRLSVLVWLFPNDPFTYGAVVEFLFIYISFISFPGYWFLPSKLLGDSVREYTET